MDVKLYDNQIVYEYLKAYHEGNRSLSEELWKRRYSLVEYVKREVEQSGRRTAIKGLERYEALGELY